jgi:hypothetical protein
LYKPGASKPSCSFWYIDADLNERISDVDAGNIIDMPRNHPQASQIACMFKPYLCFWPQKNCPMSHNAAAALALDGQCVHISISFSAPVQQQKLQLTYHRSLGQFVLAHQIGHVESPALVDCFGYHPNAVGYVGSTDDKDKHYIVNRCTGGNPQMNAQTLCRRYHAVWHMP